MIYVLSFLLRHRTICYKSIIHNRNNSYPPFMIQLHILNIVKYHMEYVLPPSIDGHYNRAYTYYTETITHRQSRT